MRRILLGASALAILSMLAPVGASDLPAPAAPAWTVCKAEGISVRTNRGSRQTFYLSGAVTSPEDQGFGKAFARFIEEKYLGTSMREPPACWSASTQAEAQGSIDKKVDATRWNIVYVATGWTNAPASPAASAPPEDPPAESP